jgi:hypothetical protein
LRRATALLEQDDLPDANSLPQPVEALPKLINTPHCG